MFLLSFCASMTSSQPDVFIGVFATSKTRVSQVLSWALENQAHSCYKQDSPTMEVIWRFVFCSHRLCHFDAAFSKLNQPTGQGASSLPSGEKLFVLLSLFGFFVWKCGSPPPFSILRNLGVDTVSASVLMLALWEYS